MALVTMTFGDLETNKLDMNIASIPSWPHDDRITTAQSLGVRMYVEAQKFAREGFVGSDAIPPGVRAVVTVEVEDEDKGILFRFGSEPGWPGPAADDQRMTPAQQFGLAMLDIWKRVMDGKDDPSQEIREEDIFTNEFDFIEAP